MCSKMKYIDVLCGPQVAATNYMEFIKKHLLLNDWTFKLVLTWTNYQGKSEYEDIICWTCTSLWKVISDRCGIEPAWQYVGLITRLYDLPMINISFILHIQSNNNKTDNASGVIVNLNWARRHVLFHFPLFHISLLIRGFDSHQRND